MAPETSRLRRRALLLAASVLAAVACRSVTPPGTTFDSRPPGAEVLIDGRRSGYVTPCTIALDRDERYVIGFELPGHEPRSVLLAPDGWVEWIPFGSGALANSGMEFPLALSIDEFLLPRRTSDALAPGRVFVRLDPARR